MARIDYKSNKFPLKLAPTLFVTAVATFTMSLLVIFVLDGRKDYLDLNSTMVLNGWAIAYRYYSKDYVEEEEEAKRDKKGIWIGDFEEPYLFRKKNK